LESPADLVVAILGLMAGRSDIELLAAWRDGDRAAGGELLDRHFDTLYRFFSAKVGSAAEDLVQQTMTACIRGGAAFRGDASFRAYLFGIARRELYDFVDREHRDIAHHGGSPSSALDPGTSPSEAVARKGRDRLLLAALRRLPLEQQIAVEFYYFEDLRGRDLNEALGIPPGTIRSRLRLALTRLRRELEQLELAPELLADTLTTLAGWARKLREEAATGER
jgi:RNA polymerase sigma-70 factor (ECF subfamily)